MFSANNDDNFKARGLSALPAVAGIILLGVSAPLFAKDLVERSYSYDSSVTIAGVSPKDTRWLMVEIASEERPVKTQQMVYWPGNTPLPPVYLNQGAGNYTIHVYSSGASLSTANQYKYVTSMKVENKDLRKLAYLLPSLDIQSQHPEIKALAMQITAGLSTDREKSMAIHDWLTENVAYDSEGVDKKTYAATPNDAVSVMRSKLGVCMGYANLTAALHRAIGIRSRIAIGELIGQSDESKTKAEICANPEKHAWAEVYFEDRWVAIDSTLDAGHRDGDTLLFVRTPRNRKYFDPNPALFAYTHLKCSEDIEDVAAPVPALGGGVANVLIP